MKNKYIVLVAIIGAISFFAYYKLKIQSKTELTKKSIAVKEKQQKINTALAIAALQQDKDNKARKDRIRKEQWAFIKGNT